MGRGGDVRSLFCLSCISHPYLGTALGRKANLLPTPPLPDDRAITQLWALSSPFHVSALAIVLSLTPLFPHHEEIKDQTGRVT